MCKKLTILFLIFWSKNILAQNDINEIKDIANSERRSKETLFGNILEKTAASNNFDVKYYRCEWEIDPAVRFINGKVTVYFTAIGNIGDLTMDLDNALTIDSIKQRNVKLSYTHTSNQTKITFNNTINNAVVDSISIFYKGAPANTGFGAYNMTTHAGVPITWTLSEPYGSKDWWPCKNGLDDKADSLDVLITCPSAYRAASNGLLIYENTISGGTKKIAFFKHRYPIATYLVCMAVTNYDVFDRTAQVGNNSMLMQTFCYPESRATFEAGTQNAIDQLQYFSNLLGEYPFVKEKYGHTQFGWGGGMEHQTNSFMVSLNESLVAHELAHQWFGDRITCGSWEDIWLNEGFASHLAQLWMETKYPSTFISGRRGIVNNITSAIGGSVKVDDTTNLNRIFNGRLSYNKGSYVISMLRLVLGDATFFSAIKKYLNDTNAKYGYAKTPLLKKYLEDESNTDLTKFFNSWYSGEGYPSYTLTWSNFGSQYVKFNLSQVTSMPSSVAFFEMPVPILFKNATQQKTILVNNTVNNQNFFEKIGFVPDSAFIDPEIWMITKNNVVNKIIDNSNAQANSLKVLNSPSLNSVRLMFQNFTNNNVVVSLFTSSGQLAFKQSITLVNGTELLELNTSALAVGIYNLQVQTADYKTTKKVLLKK
jgi:aminopeptidase N